MERRESDRPRLEFWLSHLLCALGKLLHLSGLVFDIGKNMASASQCVHKASEQALLPGASCSAWPIVMA